MFTIELCYLAGARRDVVSDDMRVLMVHGAERHRPGRSKHPLDPRAQAMELVDRYKRAHVKYELKPGDLCVEKTGMGIFDDSPVLIFWRVLDPAVWCDRKIMKDFIKKEWCNGVNCLIGRLDDDANRVYFVPHMIEFLEPYVEAKQ